MKTYTITQIKSHFKGVPYSCSPIFIGLLVKNEILVKMTVGNYAYDLDKLSKEVIELISEECCKKQLTYNKRYYDRINSQI